MEMGKLQLMLQRQTHFHLAQVLYAQNAEDMTTMTTLDEDGWLPLHHALKGGAPLGSIKLLVKGNPSAVQTADNNMAFPLHVACEFSSVKVVKLLVENYGSSLNHIDERKDSILHYACRGGNLGVIKYLLESHAPLVSSATVNAKNELPIHLLCEASKDMSGDSESTEYIETIWLLLLANPEVVVA
jgi:ankyrin repeat protein